LVGAYFRELGLEGDGAELIFEPGRAITASAQMLLLSVMRVKRGGRGTPDVILDGGKNVTTPLDWEFHEIHPVGKMSDSKLRSHNLYGPLCHPHDIVALHKAMPTLEAGDVVAVMDAGAYFIASQTNFSNPRPGVVAIENGVAQPVRIPESYADIVRLDAAFAPSRPQASSMNDTRRVTP
jgi:diaminopimelate decarboxylase